MKKIFSTILLAVLFLQPFSAVSAKFSDVPASSPYAKDIQNFENLGLVEGDSFEPTRLVTRQEYAMWMLKNSGFHGESYKPKGKKRFLDVPVRNNPYAPFVYKLADLGLFDEQAPPFLFYPKKPITRKDALLWTLFVEGITVPKIFDTKEFTVKDVIKTSKIAPLMSKALEYGFIKSGVVGPFHALTRQEAAHYLVSAQEKAPKVTVTILQGAASDISRNPKFDVLSEAWNRIFQSYLKRSDVKRDDLVYGAIEGMVKELRDAHSDFERPGNNAVIDSLSGQVEGIGAVLQMKDGQIVVVTPIVGSPADRAGILPNDIIISVDGVSVASMKLAEVVPKIKGKKGTKVVIGVTRGSTTLTFTITRDVVNIVSASVSYTADGIAEIVLTDFGEKTIDEFTKIVFDLRAKKPKGIIIDERNNPGGFLDTAVTIAGFFIKSGETVTVVRYPDHKETQVSSGTAELSGMKTIVLANGGSASASEILAGALQDYGLAKVVGEKTYGKGTVQELSDFTDGSSLKLTVAEWLTPHERSIEKTGIAPDIEVKLTDADRAAGKDPQLDRALEELRK